MSVCCSGGWRYVCSAVKSSEPGTMPYSSLIRLPNCCACPSSSCTSAARLSDLLRAHAVGVDRVGDVAHHRLDLHPVRLRQQLDDLVALLARSSERMPCAGLPTAIVLLRSRFSHSRLPRALGGKRLRSVRDGARPRRRADPHGGARPDPTISCQAALSSGAWT